MKKIVATCAAISILIASTANAKPCWIDKVYLQEAGMAVRFSDNAPHRIYVDRATPPSGTVFDRAANGYQELDGNFDPVGQPVDAIPLVVGDDAFLPVTPENTCTVYAVVRNGQQGLSSHAYFYDNIPGHTQQTEDDFVPAEPSDKNFTPARTAASLTP